MPNIESQQNSFANNEKESHNLFQDAYDFGNHARPDIEGRLRQLNLIGYGAVAGGIKDIPNEFLHHPWETVGKASAAGAVGVGLGAALAADSPIIVSGAMATSVALSAASLWHTCVKFASNKQLMHSLDSVYKSGDKQVKEKSQKVAADVIGPEAFDYGLGIASGFASMYAPKLSEKLPLNFVTDKLKGFIPFAHTMSDDPVRMNFKDGSQIHMHGSQAFFEKDGKEYQLKINNNGIDMSVLGSLAGHQLLKGVRNGPGSDIDNAIKIDIDPKKQNTKLFTYMPASYEGEKYDKSNGAGWFLNSCNQCKIELDAIGRALEEEPTKSYDFTQNRFIEKSKSELDGK